MSPACTLVSESVAELAVETARQAAIAKYLAPAGIDSATIDRVRQLGGNGFAEIASELWPIALFMAVVITAGIKVFRRTLD